MPVATWGWSAQRDSSLAPDDDDDADDDLHHLKDDDDHNNDDDDDYNDDDDDLIGNSEVVKGEDREVGRQHGDDDEYHEG